MTQAGWRLVAPDGFDELDWFGVESRGLLMGGRLAYGDRTFPVIVYDPYRLSQDAEAETADGGIFYEGNVVSVQGLTRESAEAAVTRLGEAGFLDWLLG
ncbi:hypothetical protein HPO96_31595 [Kribbella sandramycini]|uniref:Uncharacterized protein n=1 Tax=Kribbella sandramycini TaxID=60450 RepID=A0A7Y4L5J8_9ACTN|nr:hypothetical protein [Kribbella sandramycini]MBB6567087.1 hypothetical protein [Kribbella sandramycini]NOL44805.1 hypothetical protein [Kribbella sandramycini]